MGPRLRPGEHAPRAVGARGSFRVASIAFSVKCSHPTRDEHRPGDRRRQFFRKEWPQTELDGLAAKERQAGEKVILPIWHRVTKDEVLNYSPTLAEVFALNTAIMTVAQIADEIADVVDSTR